MITFQRLRIFFGRLLKTLERHVRKGKTTTTVTLSLPPFVKVEFKTEPQTNQAANQNQPPRRRRSRR